MKIHDNEGKLLAIIVKKNEQTAGKNFYTDDSSELQLATFELSEDEIIDRHIHDDQIRNIVKNTKLKVYDLRNLYSAEEMKKNKINVQKN